MESDTTDEKGETVSPKESSDESITNTKDCDKSSTNTPEQSVTSNHDCGKSVESATINNSEESVISNQDCSTSEAEESSHDQKWSPESVYHVAVSHKLKLGPLQTQVAKVQVNDKLPQVLQIGRLIPSKELESQHCDLLEHPWEGDKESKISVTNWEMKPITILKGTVVGTLEAVELVTAEDPIWKEPVDPIVAAGSDDSEQE